jgi:S1-C subfamily serine protease
MDDFGVRKPGLRAIAKKPQFPIVGLRKDAEQMINRRKYMYWAQSKLWSPRGEEFSAFGIDFSSTGVAMDGIFANTLLYQLGFRNGDLIQQVDGSVIKSVSDLRSHIQANRNKTKHLFKLIRNQQKTELTISVSLPDISN